MARKLLTRCSMSKPMMSTISEDSPTSDAPLCSLDVEVLPPPGIFPMAELQLVRGRVIGRKYGAEWSKEASAWVELPTVRDG